MFIMFDSSLIENLSTQSDQYKNELLDLLRDATNSMCHKNHYVSTVKSSVAKDFVDFAKKKNENTIANAFQYIYEKFSILNSVRDNLNYVVSIGIYEKDFEIINKIIRINYSYALKQHFWDETSLVLENIDDDKYIKSIVDYEKNKPFIQEMKNIEYKYRKEQGGGNININQTFLARLKEHSFILAFLDTDKKYPNDKYGPTANNFELDNTIIKYKNIFYYIPNVHEIENLFSSDGFMELSNYTIGARNKIKELEGKNIKDSNLFRAFLDIKKGYTYKTLDNEYLKDLFEIHNITLECDKYPPSPCPEKGCNKPKLLEAGKRTYLSDIFNNSELSDKFDSAASSLIPEIRTEWEKICKIFITSCCCNSDKVIGVN